MALHETIEMEALATERPHVINLSKPLQTVGSKNFSRAEILESIQYPSKQIKPSMGGVRITKKDGSILLGRVINSDKEQLAFMVVGNQIVNVKKNEIEKMVDETRSLMFENLLSGMTNEKREALLDFLMSLSENN